MYSHSAFVGITYMKENSVLYFPLCYEYNVLFVFIINSECNKMHVI